MTSGKELFDLYRHLIGPGYFETLGIPTLMGRVLDERDTAAGPQVAVVNQTLARKAFGEDNPLGRILRFGSSPVRTSIKAKSLRSGNLHLLYVIRTPAVLKLVATILSPPMGNLFSESNNRTAPST